MMSTTYGAPVLKPQQRKAIEGLLLFGEISAAAKHAGCSRDSVYRWQKDTAFVAALKDAERGALEELGRILLRLSTSAALVIGETMRDKTIKPETRLRAADVALQRLIQIRELVDLEERVAVIEAALKAQQEGGTK